jgi:hypothetical protein
VNDNKRDLFLDCLNHLWALSKKTEDYWTHVASLEREEALSFFQSLIKHPTQLAVLFTQLSSEDSTKIHNSLFQINQRSSSQVPGFFELSLWASIIELRSSATRHEFFKLAWDLDSLSRKMLGSYADTSAAELESFIVKAKRYMSLSKFVHPSFSHTPIEIPKSENKKLVGA